MLVTREPSIAIGALDGSPRERLQAAHDLRARAVTLDATLAGLRPRELDRSARRGLCALLRRLELRLEGIDLFIPAEHFADTSRQDRALSAVREACEFLVEASSLVETTPMVHLTTADGEAGRISEETGVALSAPVEAAPPFVRSVDLGKELLAERDPLKSLGAAENLGVVRLRDSKAGSAVALGEGELDLMGAHAVVTTTAPGASLVIDPRGLPGARAAAGRSLTAWADAARSPF